MLLTSFAKTSQLPQKATSVYVCVCVNKHVKVSLCLRCVRLYVIHK